MSETKKKKRAKKKTKKKPHIPKQMGTPLISIDPEQFEKMCEIQCTCEEIASVMGCSHDTVEAWCKDIYHENFSVVYKRLSSGGKMSLRRSMDKAAHGTPAFSYRDEDGNMVKVPAEKPNPTLLIWLSKQHLGMTDQPIDETAREEYKPVESLSA